MLNPAPTTWRTHDGKVIPITELGDQHLVNILKKIEANRAGIQPPNATTPPLNQNRMRQYDDLVIEAVRRGLFEWKAERKYLTPAMDAITAATTVVARFAKAADARGFLTK